MLDMYLLVLNMLSSKNKDIIMIIIIIIKHHGIKYTLKLLFEKIWFLWRKKSVCNISKISGALQDSVCYTNDAKYLLPW